MYSGIYSCAVHIFTKEGGLRALYRGFTPTIFGMVPYAGLSFYCFESFKYFCMRYFPGESSFAATFVIIKAFPKINVENYCTLNSY